MLPISREARLSPAVVEEPSASRIVAALLPRVDVEHVVPRRPLALERLVVERDDVLRLVDRLRRHA